MFFLGGLLFGLKRFKKPEAAALLTSSENEGCLASAHDRKKPLLRQFVLFFPSLIILVNSRFEFGQLFAKFRTLEDIERVL